MTVKELRAKLSTVPEDAQVEMVMCQMITLLRTLAE